MATDRDQPWWADAQEYRHRETRRRSLDDVDPSRSENEFAANAARRRRAAAARAAAQQRRARQRRPEPVEFPWVDESPFGGQDEGSGAERERSRRVRDRTREPGTEVARRPGGAAARRRPGARPARRRRRAGVLARPEKLLLYVAILGLFLVLAAATNSDAAVVVQHASSLTR